MYSWIEKIILPSSAFVVGFSLMVMELTASRVIAPIVGSSLYTWTSVIGIIMLGLAAGNFIGGYYIDKKKSTKIIFVFFVLSAISVLVIPIIASFSRKITLLEIALPLIIILITFLIFFVPSLFIGCIYPCIFKLYLKEFSAVGKKAGSISAFWTLGSILGTFLTGFVLISYLGSANTLLTIAILLFLNGLFFYFPSQKNVLLVVIFFSSVGIFFYGENSLAGRNKALFSKESAYYWIKIIDVKNKLSYGNARFMFLDFDSHGVEGEKVKSMNLYTNVYPVFSVIAKNIKNILVIGGGAETITKNFAAFYQGSQVTNVEIDPDVSVAAKKFFNTDYYKIKNEISDGRFFLQKNSKKYDLIFNDAYNSFISVPWHLSTQEFNELSLSRLEAEGIYAVNFISAREGDGSQFFQSMLKTFKTTFPNHYIFSFDNDPQKAQNIVLVGVNSKEHLSEDKLKEGILPLVNGDLLSKNIITEPIKGGDESKIPILRDDFAPTERLMDSIVKTYFASFASFHHSLFQF